MCKSASLMEGTLQPDGSIELELDDGWFRTGDVGAIGERGTLVVTGRLKNAIIRGGINIFPSEIESVYGQCDDVAECCALALEDEELGQRICLVVALRQGSSRSEEELRDYAIGRIDKCKVPDTVFKMTSIPCLDNGKVDRAALEKIVRTMSCGR